MDGAECLSFHPISFSSEWRLTLPFYQSLKVDTFVVSIQLVSPASGDSPILNPYLAKSLEAVCEGMRI